MDQDIYIISYFYLFIIALTVELTAFWKNTGFSSSSQPWVSLSGRGQRRGDVQWITQEDDVERAELKSKPSSGGHGETSDLKLFTFIFIQMEYTFMQIGFQVIYSIF